MQNTELLIQISKDIATNTAKTESILEQLKTLNGKVAAHEVRLQATEGNQALTTTAVAQIKAAENKRDENKSRLTWLTIENIFKAVATIIIAYFLYKAGI